MFFNLTIRFKYDDFVRTSPRHSALQTDVDLACFTETWLTDFLHDNVIQIPGYNVVRRDCLIGQHGGVCLYIKESIPFEIFSQYHNDQFEVLSVKARPYQSPRGLSCIIIGSIYHPPIQTIEI